MLPDVRLKDKCHSRDRRAGSTMHAAHAKSAQTWRVSLHHQHNDEPLHRAVPDNALYTPPTIGHAERVVHRLLERYRRRNASEGQHAVARMYGHASWPLLQAAVAAGAATSLFDEEETGDVVRARRERQRDVVLVWLAGVDEETARAARTLDHALLARGPHTISQRYDPQYNRKRLDRARYVHNLAYAHHVVEEIRPTSRGAADIPRDDDELELGLRVNLLPRALKSWLAHHRPLLERWSGIIGNLRVRQRCPTELLDLSFAWGELCLLHGADIPKALQVYPIALCAQWYGWLACLEAPALKVELAVLEDSRSSEAERRRAQQAVQQAIRCEEARFLLAQPREDFRLLSPAARRQQIQAGHAVLRRYMADAAAEQTIKTILEKPSWLSLSPLLAAP